MKRRKPQKRKRGKRLRIVPTLNIVLGRKKQELNFNWSVGRPTLKKEGGTMLEVTVTSDEKVLVTISAETTGGSPVDPIAPPILRVLSGDGTFLVVDVKNFWLISGSVMGNTAYEISADFDPGRDGTSERLTDNIVLTVGEPRVATLGFKVGEPVSKNS